MLGEGRSRCWTCGADVGGGCVVNEECEDCKRKRCKHENWIEVSEGHRACRDCWQLESDLIKKALEGEE